MPVTRATTVSLSLLTLVALTLAGCSATSSATAQSVAGSEGVALPPTSGVFDYQLDGTYDEVDAGSGPVGIDVVVRDADAEPLAGAYNVCYVNGFQTQPEDAELWLEHPDLLLSDGADGFATDPGWPGEYVLDPSTNAQREGILAIVAPLVAQCADRGFDALEVDNLDTFDRFPAIDRDGSLALATAYAQLAHEHGLAIGQKNAAELAQVAHAELGFDFAIAEECGVWEECGAYAEVYGDQVLQIEYTDQLDAEAFAGVCALADRAPLTILRDRYLGVPGDADYVYDNC
ncbi:endo alpha-1,4 polygalactosaminidase [Microbacterium sp.]|uniref:endo alpha-1,4 polygalactosaminidase n=1 Tax=Microbacterium sp. TaxID=51671 RepID=UPI0039E5684A